MKKLIFMIFIIMFAVWANGDKVIKLWEDYNITSPQQKINNQNIEKKDNSLINIKFNNNYDSALRDAKNGKKYIFLIVTEQYCPWCEKLIDEVLPYKEVGSKLIENYIPVIVDRNNDYYPSNIGITGTPSVFIINPYTSKIIDTIVGYRDRNFYINRLDGIMALDR